MSYQFGLIEIDSGRAGFTASGKGARFGAKTLIIEANRPGSYSTRTVAAK